MRNSRSKPARVARRWASTMVIGMGLAAAAACAGESKNPAARVDDRPKTTAPVVTAPPPTGPSVTPTAPPPTGPSVTPTAPTPALTELVLCGCGCCGGVKPADGPCVARGGETLEQIQVRDLAERHDRNCATAGCSAGRRLLYCP
jgi:hypothetical protein